MKFLFEANQDVPSNVLASITPAERSVIARWVRQPIKPEGNVSSPYIKTVLAGLSDKTDIVMAMDLEGAVGLPTIRKRLDESEVEGVTDRIANRSQLAGPGLIPVRVGTLWLARW